LNFFHGFRISNLPFDTFGVVFVVSLFLFAAIFWAIRKKASSNNS